VVGVGWRGAAARVSENGTLVYVTQPLLPLREILWIGRDGKETRLPVAPAGYEQVEISPDGANVLLVRRDEAWLWTLWTYNLRSGAWTRIVSDPGRFRAVWSPD